MSDVLRDLLVDLRFAARAMRRSPGFAILALATLALGIGANSAIFSVLDATLLRPLPFHEPERLLKVSLRAPREGGAIDMTWSYPKFLEATREELFESQALYIHQGFTIGAAEGGERIPGEAVSADYLRTLGVRPLYGAGIAWTDDGGTPTPSILLGNSYWRRRHASDPRVVGTTVDINGHAMTIAGILPPGFRGLTGRADVFVPIPIARPQSMTQLTAHQFDMVARATAGTSIAVTKERVRDFGARLAAMHPTAGDRWGAAAYTFEEVRVDAGVKRAILVAAGGVGLLLLLTCVNVAGLLLARAAGRRREMAIRIATGAKRGRLVRQLLAESALLAAIAAALSVGVAWVGVRLLRLIAPMGAGDFAGAFSEDVSGLTMIGLQGVRLDLTTLAFTALAALLAALIFGLLPAVSATHTNLIAALRGVDQNDAAFLGVRRLTPRSLLVVAEVALAVVLLIGSGLTLRSLGKLLDAPVGFDRENVLTARVSVPGIGAPQEATAARWSELLERLAAIPGVEHVGAATCAPVSTECEGTGFSITPDDQVPVGLHGASPGYFEALRVPLLSGRYFSSADVASSPRVLIVNKAAVDEYWNGVSPVGRRVQFWGDTVEIVGVVGNIRYDRPEEAARPAVYLPFAQRPFAAATIFVRAARIEGLASSLRSEVRRLDPGNALYDLKSMSERLGDATARTRFIAFVLAAFAALALTLASVGIYGVMSLTVAQRTREIGIRIALGASGRRVVGMVVGQGMLLALLGAVAGLVLSTALARALGGLLFEVGQFDAPTHRTIMFIVAGVALVATFIPALRAARLDALVAIKRDQ
ncbi:MAG TPA: ADOP family duplicated permease [Gemmatimonadaceae bacterium]|nr:ADOP family duplicated permease [Gemmatimonadaceae bacterium]